MGSFRQVSLLTCCGPVDYLQPGSGNCSHPFLVKSSCEIAGQLAGRRNGLNDKVIPFTSKLVDAPLSLAISPDIHCSFRLFHFGFFKNAKHHHQ